jgi:hypothetical protein
MIYTVVEKRKKKVYKQRISQHKELQARQHSACSHKGQSDTICVTLQAGRKIV